MHGEKGHEIGGWIAIYRSFRKIPRYVELQARGSLPEQSEGRGGEGGCAVAVWRAQGANRHQRGHVQWSDATGEGRDTYADHLGDFGEVGVRERSTQTAEVVLDELGEAL